MCRMPAKILVARKLGEERKRKIWEEGERGTLAGKPHDASHFARKGTLATTRSVLSRIS